ncbi:MAG: hypothetical protein IJX90_06660 [Blautia sp.]|nr:hypothetical protein [Blautia sp.]
MLGIVYLFLALFPGMHLASFLIRKKQGQGNLCWIFWPTAFLAGVVTVTWVTYVLAWILHVMCRVGDPLRYADGIVMAGCLFAFVIWFCRKDRTAGWRALTGQMVEDHAGFKKEVVLYIVVFLFALLTMTYVFQVKDRVLHAGLTVFSDYAPHTAMIRSFSLGANYPTQYPHFGGEDVKYHFMFQFLTGNLEYLGLRIDLAYNLASALSLTGFLMVLCQLTGRLFGSFMAKVWIVVFFVFRSGTAFFRFAAEHLQAGDLWETLRDNTTFIGYTPNENWGLWNYNVYLNQRHLCLGLLAAAVLVWIFMDWLDAGCAHEEKGLSWLRGRLFSAEAWRPRNAGTALVSGVLLGLCSFWNGAAVIGALLILAGMALFSDGKLDYALMALVTIILSELQTKVFISGKAFSLSFYWGFISENKSPAGVLLYLTAISGFAILGAVFLLFILKGNRRFLVIAFLIPVCFAFTCSLTPDVTVNHKYIMIAMAFLSVIWGGIVAHLCTGGIPDRLLALLVVVCLTATGIYDFVIIVRDNDEGHRIGVDLDSDLTAWLAENVTSEDLVLTPQYSINEVTMSGCMMYMGWPYYPWSAGYDTYYRNDQEKLIYGTDDPEELAETVDREKIGFILYDEGMTIDDMECREDVIASVYPLVYEAENGRVRIYETR